MTFNKTTHYCLKILSSMALDPERSYTADQLSEETKIPKRYLRKLMTELSKNGFITGSRGRSGGFSFARDIAEISLFEIIRSMEGESLQENCILGFTFCLLGAPCPMHDEWSEANNKILRVLKKTTLRSLTDKYSNHFLPEIK